MWEINKQSKWEWIQFECYQFISDEDFVFKHKENKISLRICIKWKADFVQFKVIHVSRHNAYNLYGHIIKNTKRFIKLDTFERTPRKRRTS